MKAFDGKETTIRVDWQGQRIAFEAEGPRKSYPMRLGACRAEAAAEALTGRPSSGILYSIGLVGSHGAPSFQRNPVGRSVRANFVPLQAVVRLQSRLMLYARQTKSHSMRTLGMPRSRNCRRPIALLMMPKTGSTLAARLP